MFKKRCLSVWSVIIISTFFWSQFIWAYGIELYEPPQKNFPINLPETSEKEISRIPTKEFIDTLKSALETLKIPLQYMLELAQSGYSPQMQGYIDDLIRQTEEARRRSQELVGQAREKVEQAKRRKEEAERQADSARYLVKCGDCDNSFEIYYGPKGDDTLEIGGVFASKKEWRKIFIPLLNPLCKQ